MSDSPVFRPITASSRVAVLGAGLLGRLLAWQLSRRGIKLSLFEASSFTQPRSAAHTAAAMISPLSEVVSAERIIYDMGMRSLQLWPQLLAQLNQNRPNPISYSDSGSLVVAHPQDFAELQQFKRDLQHKLQGDDQSRWLGQQELQDWEPALGHFNNGLYLPAEAHLDNRHLLASLLEAIREEGTECIDNCPVEISGSKLKGPRPLGDFDLILDCRGMGSKAEQPALRGVRGEVMWVESKELSLRQAVRLMHPRYKLYVVPKPGHRFIIGATEIESEDRSAISLQSTLELASALYTINPALAEARVVETDSNLRPAFRDNLPQISQAEQVIRVNGLYRHGYLLAPVVVEEICNYLFAAERGPFWHALANNSRLSLGAGGFGF